MASMYRWEKADGFSNLHIIFGPANVSFGLICIFIEAFDFKLRLSGVI